MYGAINSWLVIASGPWSSPNHHGILHAFAGGIPLVLCLMLSKPVLKTGGVGGSKGGVLLPLTPQKRCIFSRSSDLNQLAFPQETSIGLENFQRALVQNKVIQFQNSFNTARWGGGGESSQRDAGRHMDFLWKWKSRRNSLDNYLLKP